MQSGACLMSGSGGCLTSHVEAFGYVDILISFFQAVFKRCGLMRSSLLKAKFSSCSFMRSPHLPAGRVVLINFSRGTRLLSSIVVVVIVVVCSSSHSSSNSSSSNSNSNRNNSRRISNNSNCDHITNGRVGASEPRPTNPLKTCL